MQDIAIVGGSLFDGTGAAPRQETILISDGKIAALGDAAEPAGGTLRIDANGAFVMPGMIDCHVHLTSTAAANYELQRLKDLLPLQTLRGAANARTILRAGFTTVRDLSAPGFSNVAIRQAIEQGITTGPRVLAAGMSLTVPGGHGDSYYRPDVDVNREGIVNGPDEARRAVREWIKMRVDVIKLLVTGGVMTDGSDLGALQWTPDELVAAIRQAHQLGKRVAGHCHGGEGVKAGVRAGLDTVEHGTMLDDEAVGLMAEYGTYLVPTLVASQNIVKHGTAGGIAPHVVAKAEQVADWHRRSVGMAHRGGVKIAFGTDCGTPFNRPGENAAELGLLVECGLSPLEALLAVTRTASEAVGLSDRIGTLEVGKDADVIVVAGDPLANVGILNDPSLICWVLKGGVVAREPGDEARDARA
ncbi:MAG: amidohydrolase family protein [Chloroflexi bacterium]|nr:amidohydrolase family protein [Chloroflexota bacterium]